MDQANFKVYGYRWVVLSVFMLVIALNQLLWITFAPITSEAAGYYQVTDLTIGLLSMSFMIVYIFVSIPASWVIDTYGFRTAVTIGALLTGEDRAGLAAQGALVPRLRHLPRQARGGRCQTRIDFGR